PPGGGRRAAPPPRAAGTAPAARPGGVEMFPSHRPRRLRTTAAMRGLVGETTVRPNQLVLPMFVKEGATEPVPVATMPGVVQHTRDSLRKAAVEAVEGGVGWVL